MRVAVIGGGVIGLTLAWEMQQAGAEVVVLEKGKCGAGASAANAGWLTPAFSAPLPAPGVIPQALRWLLVPQSPFALRLRPSRGSARWLHQFASFSSEQHHEAGTQALVRLTSGTFEQYRRLKESGVSFEMHAPGLLFLARSTRALAGYRRTLEKLATFGYQGEPRLLGQSEALALEPRISRKVRVALHAPLEQCVRPETLTAGLVQAIAGASGEVRETSPVFAIRKRGHEWEVDTTTGAVHADRIVLAAGMASRGLARMLGFELPLEAAKGYSLTTATVGPNAHHLLYFSERKIAYSRFADAVRLAGFLELGAESSRFSHSRVRALTASAEEYLESWRPCGQPIFRTGLRTLTPDGLPLIGAAPRYEDIYVATGHGMLGVTLAPATAAALAPLVVGLQGTAADLRPFSPSRFDRSSLAPAPATT